MSRREEAKQGRRRRIIDAAKRLLEETGGTGFTMRELAKTSEVSPATPFNLFGTKNAVLLCVFDEDLTGFLQQFEALSSDSTIHRFFDMVSLAGKVIRERRSFYKAIYSAISAEAPSDLRSGLMSPRAQIYEALVADALSHGDLDEVLSPQAFGTSVAYVMGGVLQRWIAGEIEIEDFEAHAGYGVALLLSGIISDRYRGFVRDKILLYQERIDAVQHPITTSTEDTPSLMAAVA